MKKFDYRLQKVLKVRRIREGQVQAQLAREAGFLQGRQQELQQNSQMLQKHRGLILQKGGISAQDILYNADYVQALEFKEERLEQIISISEQRLEGHRKALSDARKESEKLEMDKDHHRLQWHQMMNFEEQKLLDERNNRHRRKKPGA